MMKKLFNKTWLHALTLVLIGATVFMLSPLAVAISQGEIFASASSDAIPVITTAGAVNFLSGLPPRASHEEIAVCLQKVIAVFAVVVGASAINVEDLRRFAEGRHYALANDLQFNIPLLTYRQSSTEHSSEG
jgi:hypothetical protein